MLWQRITTIFWSTIHLMHVMWQMIYGCWRVSGLKQPIVTIFGGSQIMPTDFYAKKASDFAHMLVKNDISLLTGGGPGIMEAASCGILLEEGKGMSMGIGVEGLEGPNRCAHVYFMVDYFFARKWLLTRFSSAVVVFPGGFGTLDELFELFVLIQEKKMKDVPVILVGSEFWNPLFVWLRDMVEKKHNLIAMQSLHLFKIEDDLDQVLCLVKNSCDTKPKSDKPRHF